MIPSSVRRCLTASAILLAGLVAACSQRTAGRAEAASFTLLPAGYEQLSGWGDDHFADALPAFLRSCERFLSQRDDDPLDPKNRAGDFGRVGDWRPLCTAATRVRPGDEPAARRFFEDNLQPVMASVGGASEMLVTGYYEVELQGSRERTGPFQTPVYRTPPDLASRRPYYSRGEIEDGALAGRGLELIWLKSPTELFYLQLQGSGRVHLTDGSTIRLIYDGNNGRRPVALDRLLVDRGLIAAKDLSTANVRRWLDENPEPAKGIRRKSELFVFFKEGNGNGPIGEMGAVLTPERSLAVDRSFVPLGLPIWIEARERYRAGAVNRLVLSQDTGDDIKGPLRGDYFWGTGPDAFAKGADMYASGRAYFLLPRTIATRVLASR